MILLYHENTLVFQQRLSNSIFHSLQLRYGGIILNTRYYFSYINSYTPALDSLVPNPPPQLAVCIHTASNDSCGRRTGNEAKHCTHRYRFSRQLLSETTYLKNFGIIIWLKTIDSSDMQCTIHITISALGDDLLSNLCCSRSEREISCVEI